MDDEDDDMDVEDPEEQEPAVEPSASGEDIYDEDDREELLDDDEIEPWEEGFMLGAEGGGQDAKCRTCGKVLKGPEDIIEKKIKGHILRFCSDLCADAFEEKLDEHEDQI